MSNAADSKAKRARGRSLSDFKNLSWAEKKLMACSARGRKCVLGKSAPDAPTRANAVRPDLIRFLALGGDENAPVHEKGVRLEGAYIGAIPNGEEPQSLDLQGAKLPVSLWLFNCRFDAKIFLVDACGRSIGLDGSVFPGLQGDRLFLEGSLHFRMSKATGEVRLSGTKIRGDLTCGGARLDNASGNALFCDSAEIGGSVSLREPFYATGAVRFLGAKIAGDLRCLGGRFENAGSNALCFDGAEIGGDVDLSQPFQATGEVRLLGAKIAGDLNCMGGRFHNTGGDALSCHRTEIRGALFFRHVWLVHGKVSFAHAHAAILVDDLSSWPEKALDLDGFRYDHIAADAPLDADSRISWLDRQQSELLTGKSFALQPWTHLAKFLREQGHFRDAAEVDIAREDRLRAASKVADLSALNAAFKKWRRAWGKLGPDGSRVSIFFVVERLDDFVAWALHWFYGRLSGYGHRPMRIVYWALFTWLAFAGVFCFAASDGHFAPANAATANSMKQICQQQFAQASINWTRCEALLAAYPRFSPLAYSLDLILPVARLGQSNMWTPISDGSWFSLSGWTQRLVWIEEIFGWVAALTLGAIAAGLVKRRDG
jgi:hypothetical protein